MRTSGLRIAVLGEFEADSLRAHAVNVAKTAGGFARLGHRVMLGCLPAKTPVGVETLAANLGETGLEWRFLTGGDVGASSVAMAREFGADLVYARSFLGAAACAEAGFRVVLETHAHVGDRNPLLVGALQLAAPDGPLAAVVTISQSLRGYYVRCGADAAKVHVVPDGVDLDLFVPPVSLPLAMWGEDERPHAVYAGHLYEYKGIPTILDAAEMRPDWAFELVGGLAEDVARVASVVRARGLKNVSLHGARPHVEVPRWLWRADALLLPPLGDDASAEWTSPVKLGEYLAAGPIIIASDIPGLRAWVSEPEVRWFRAGDGAGLAGGLDDALTESPDLRAARRAAAIARAELYCYPARARAILAAAGVTQEP